MHDSLSGVRKAHLRNRAEENRRIIVETCGEEYWNALQNNALKTDDYYEGYHKIEDALFIDPRAGESVAAMIRGESQKFRQMTDEVVAQMLLDKKSDIEQLTKMGIVPILVHPEFLYLYPQIEALLKDAGIQVVQSIRKKLSFFHYWILYEHAFSDPIREPHFHRRIPWYIGRESHLLLAASSMSAAELSQRFIVEIKGTAGVFCQGTIRGQIVFSEVETLFAEQNHRLSLLALDPWQGRVYDGDELYGSRIAPKEYAKFPGVHIPEPHELAKDLGILVCTDEIG